MSTEQAEKVIVSAIHEEKSGKRIRIKTKADSDKGPPEKVKVRKNGKVVEVKVPEMNMSLSQSVWADTLGLSKKEARAFFKEHPEYRPARKEVGDRVRGLCEDGLSFFPRVAAKYRHSTLGTIVNGVAVAAVAGVVGVLAWERWGGSDEDDTL